MVIFFHVIDGLILAVIDSLVGVVLDKRRILGLLNLPVSRLLTTVVVNRVDSVCALIDIVSHLIALVIL